MTTQHDIRESLEHAGQSSSSAVFTINDKLGAISSSLPEYTIFRVHELLRRENVMAYEPEILAIGPYHRGKVLLEVMEDLKLRWLKECLEPLGVSDASEYVEAMKSLEPEARRCYSESTSRVNGDDFVEMMLLDVCFIIQFMRRWLAFDLTKPFFEDWVKGSLIRDMMIFENQIPLFVLQKLFSMIRLPLDPIHFHELALNFIKVIWRMLFNSTVPKNVLRSSNPKDRDVHHILGFLHNLLRLLAVSNNNANLVDDDESSKAKWNLQPAIKLCEAGFKFIVSCSCKRGQQGTPNTESIPSATKLNAAGVQFKSKKASESQGEQLSSPFDISFKDGIMEIPTFTIDDSTESLYRNLIAYEQYCLQSSERCVVLHANLMDCLIDSAEDVALLREYGIVDNALGNDEAVSTFLNKLVNNVHMSNKVSKVHSKVFEEVNAYCGKRWHKWMAKLKREYFNSPWALISFFAACFLLVLTFTQTVFSVRGVL